MSTSIECFTQSSLCSLLQPRKLSKHRDILGKTLDELVMSHGRKTFLLCLAVNPKVIADKLELLVWITMVNGNNCSWCLFWKSIWSFSTIYLKNEMFLKVNSQNGSQNHFSKITSFFQYIKFATNSSYICGNSANVLIYTC